MADFSRITDPGGLSFRFLNAVIDGGASIHVSPLEAPENTVILSDIGAITGSQSDDLFRFQESSSSYTMVNGGGGTDTLDLSLIGAGTGNGATVNLTTGVLRNVDGRVSSISNFENVAGTDRNDVIIGDEGNNLLIGGAGVDTLNGGAGDDILIFDAEDTDYDKDLYPVGGAGWDIGYVEGPGGVELDMDFAELEVVVGGDGDDEIGVWGNGPYSVVMAAGGDSDGDGDDTFGITDETTTAIVWGGTGTDWYYLGTDAGIMTVTVEGLTTENFADFSLDMLGLEEDFNWSLIDAVVINPDAQDQFFWQPYVRETGNIELLQLGVSEVFSYPFWDYTTGREVEEVGLIIDDDEWIAGEVRNWEHGGLSVVGSSSFSISHLESFNNTFRAANHNPLDPNRTFLDVEATGQFSTSIFGHSITSVQTQLEVNWIASDIEDADIIWELTGTLLDGTEVIGTGWREFVFSHGGTTFSTMGAVSIDGPPLTSDWFVLGGAFVGDQLVANGSISATMPGTPEPEEPQAMASTAYFGEGPGAPQHSPLDMHSEESFAFNPDNGLRETTGFSPLDEMIALGQTPTEPGPAVQSAEATWDNADVVATIARDALAFLEEPNGSVW